MYRQLLYTSPAVPTYRVVLETTGFGRSYKRRDERTTRLVNTRIIVIILSLSVCAALYYLRIYFNVAGSGPGVRGGRRRVVDEKGIRPCVLLSYRLNPLPSYPLRANNIYITIALYVSGSYIIQCEYVCAHNMSVAVAVYNNIMQSYVIVVIKYFNIIVHHSAGCCEIIISSESPWRAEAEGGGCVRHGYFKQYEYYIIRS